MRALHKKLLRDLWARKGALAALVAIVTIGVSSYVSMAAIYRDLKGSRDRYYRDQRLAQLSVDLKRCPLWAVDEVAALPNVRAAHGRIDFGVLVDLDGLDEPITGRAISYPAERRPVLNDLLLRSGAWFEGDGDRQVILNHAFAEANGLRAGDRLRVTLLDRQWDLLVIGTAMSPEFVYVMPAGGLAPDPGRSGIMFMTDAFLRRTCDLQGASNQIVGLVHDDDETAVANTLTLIEDHLEPFGVQNAIDFRDQASVRFLADEIAGLAISSSVLPTIFLGVAALILNVLLGRMVRQQRTVIGTLKAIGYGQGAITAHYMAHGVVIGVLGGVAGGALGYWMQGGLAALYRQFYALPAIDPHLYPDVLATGLLISVAFATLGTVQGVRYAVALAPAEAMQPPPPEKGARVLPERIGFVWRRLSFGQKMMTRAIFRNPFRSSVSIFASAISTALVVTALNNTAALDELMAWEFDRVSHQDVSVSLRDPVGRGVVAEVEGLPGASYAEPQLVITCDITNGSYAERIGVTGLKAGDVLYTPLDGRGDPIAVPEAGLVLSRKLAEILAVAPGDQVVLRPLLGRRERVVAPVVATVETFLGLAAYTDLDYMSRLLGEDRVANRMLTTVDGARPSEAFYDETKRRPGVIGTGERLRAFTQLQATFGESMGVMISIMVLFAGMIAFGSVLNAALVSLSEREREVATLRVLGYGPGQITSIFATESLALNVVGIGVGLAGGVGLSHLLARAYDTELYRFPVVIVPAYMALSAALMVGFVTAAQAVILGMIRRLPWLEALKARQ